MMSTIGDGPHGHWLRALIAVLWRAGLRFHEPLALAESDSITAAGRCSSVAARAAGGARPAWTSGAGSSSSHGAPCGSNFLSASVLRHQRPHPCPRRRDGPRRRPLLVIQRQLGHSDLGITSVYLQGIDSAEIIDTVHARRAPMISVNASQRL